MIYEIPRRLFLRKKITGIGYATIFPILLIALLALVASEPDLQSSSTLWPIALSGAIMFGVTLFFYWRGLRMNRFGITTEGIFPLVKPLDKLFSGRFFLPYSSIQKVEIKHSSYTNKEGKVLEAHPHMAELLLEDDSTITIGVVTGLTPLGLYLWSEKDMRGIFRLLEVIKQRISEQRSRRISSIAIPVEAFQGAMGGWETRLFRKKTKGELLGKVGEVIFLASMGACIMAAGLLAGLWVLVLVGSMLCFLSFLIGYAQLP